MARPLKVSAGAGPPTLPFRTGALEQRAGPAAIQPERRVEHGAVGIEGLDPGDRRIEVGLAVEDRPAVGDLLERQAQGQVLLEGVDDVAGDEIEARRLERLGHLVELEEVERCRDQDGEQQHQRDREAQAVGDRQHEPRSPQLAASTASGRRAGAAGR